MTVGVTRPIWQSHLTRLVDQISTQGDLRSPPWRNALLAVPRHLFVPHYYTQDTSTRPSRWVRQEPGNEESTQRWLELVYSPTTLITEVAEYADRGVQSTSIPLSSRLPGTGWTSSVTTPRWSPATEPRAWPSTLRSTESSPPAHCAPSLSRGFTSFAPVGWHWCAGPTTGSPRPTRTTEPATIRDTTVDPAQVDGTQMFPFLAQLHLPPGMYRAIYLTDDDVPVTYLASPDGSWCEVTRHPYTTGRYQVREAGSTHLWAAIETAWTQWTRLGAPPWHEFGLTATPTEHRIWHRDLQEGPQWTLSPDPLTALG